MNEETYKGEFKIKNEVGKNLLETYDVNGRRYTDNIPKNSFISIPKKQYIEYKQQEEHIERLQNITNELEKWLNKVLEIYNNVDIKTLLMVKDKLKELKEDNK